MGRMCMHCGFDNVAGRTVCKQCQKSLYIGEAPPPIQANTAHVKRTLLLLLGASLVPLAILLIYIWFVGNAAFALNGSSFALDTAVEIVALISGMICTGFIPAKRWVRALLVVLYVPLFGVGLIAFQVYFACFSGRGCL